MLQEDPNDWKKDFAEGLFTLNGYEHDKVDALYLKKYENMPRYLYRYADRNKQCEINNLKSNKIYLADPKTFNDPYDSLLCLNLLNNSNCDNGIDLLKTNPQFSESDIAQLEKIKLSDHPVHEIGKFLLRDSNVNQREIEEAAQGLANAIEWAHDDTILDISIDIATKMSEICNMGVTCFSEIKDSILMWSHYANKHTGFCLEWDFRQLGCNSLTRSFYPVIYDDNPFALDPDLNTSFIKEHGSFNPYWFVYASIHKGEEWHYEKEWRLIQYLPKAMDRLHGIPIAPKAIYLGTKFNMDDTNNRELMTIAKTKGMEIYKMRIKPLEFRLMPQRIG